MVVMLVDQHLVFSDVEAGRIYRLDGPPAEPSEGLVLEGVQVAGKSALVWWPDARGEIQVQVFDWMMKPLVLLRTPVVEVATHMVTMARMTGVEL